LPICRDLLFRDPDYIKTQPYALVQFLGSSSWEFLRVFEFTSLDLNTSSSAVEALLRSLLSLTAVDGAPAAAANTWNELLALVSNRSGSAGSFVRDQLPAPLLQRHRSSPSGMAPGLARLQEDTAIVVNGVKSLIAGQVVLPRTETVEKLVTVHGFL
jgi:hypothetical protein